MERRKGRKEGKEGKKERKERRKGRKERMVGKKERMEEINIRTISRVNSYVFWRTVAPSTVVHLKLS